MSRRKSSRQQTPSGAAARGPQAKPLRIIGGEMRGRTIAYSGHFRTRPMKERVREAMFDILATAVRGKHAIDLFAGTGALGFEALSRGAVRATLIERHFPTARLIEQSIATLGVGDRAAVYAADAFVWPRQPRDWTPWTQTPWVVLCSPPYAFYTERTADMVNLISTLHGLAPAGSEFVVESDQGFDFERLAALGEWDLRRYAPAVLGFQRT